MVPALIAAGTLSTHAGIGMVLLDSRHRGRGGGNPRTWRRLGSIMSLFVGAANGWPL
jgi:hypothetical protein